VSGVAEETLGLLLVGGTQPLPPDLQWFTSVFSQKLDQILRQHALVEGDRRQGRERSLLYNIINAVTDPILLTDTEGRLLIANARALTLFTASEEESEGRRGAVRMNTCCCPRRSRARRSRKPAPPGASCCSSTGRRIGPGVRAVEHRHRRSAAGQRRGLDSAQRHRPAARERGDRRRLPQMRIAEAQARAESDRLNLIIDSWPTRSW